MTGPGYLIMILSFSKDSAGGDDMGLGTTTKVIGVKDEGSRLGKGLVC